jgi:hypothetical protein
MSIEEDKRLAKEKVRTTLVILMSGNLISISPQDGRIVARAAESTP